MTLSHFLLPLSDFKGRETFAGLQEPHQGIGTRKVIPMRSVCKLKDVWDGSAEFRGKESVTQVNYARSSCPRSIKSQLNVLTHKIYLWNRVPLFPFETLKTFPEMSETTNQMVQRTCDIQYQQR